MKTNPLVNSNDRRDALLDMGVSPGEDDSYDVQASKLIREKDKLIDNAKLGFFQRMEVAIQNARHKGKSEGALKLEDFATQVLGKSVPSPSEMNPANLIKALPALAHGALEVAKHPLATLKQVALNGPPESSTLAAMMLPGAALKAYRNTVPLAARTYIHHMAGIPTPFTHVTNKERVALTKLAQDKIDDLLKDKQGLEIKRSHALRGVNEIKLMNRQELEDYSRVRGMKIPAIDKSIDASKLSITEKFIDTSKLRKLIVKDYKKKKPSIFNVSTEEKRDNLHLGNEMDNESVRKEFQKITGKQLRGFNISPDEFSNALGKTYVEPMIDKATGKIVPKSIKDTYKFYPDVYGYTKGQGLVELKKLIRLYAGGSIKGKAAISEALDINMDSPLGILARKLGMRRPTSIIDIPLQGPSKMNAYDRAAILLGANQAAKEKRK